MPDNFGADSETFWNHITLILVSGHNRKLYSRRTSGAKLSTYNSELNISMTLCKRPISRFFHSDALDRWVADTCWKSMKIWLLINLKRTAQALKLQSTQLRNLISVITGLWPFGRHAKGLNILSNDFCRSCKDEEEEEILEHLLCQCTLT